MELTDLSVDFAGIKMKNPIAAASGVFGYGEEYSRVGDIGWFGAVSVKGTTLSPRAGNPPPRVAETPAGMLNAIGLENPGAKVAASEKVPWLRQFGVPIIVNVSGDTYDEFAELGTIFRDVEGVAALEVNISCPNVRAGGMSFGQDARSCYRATRAVKDAFGGKVITKLTPNASDITAVARAAVEGGADALSLINTLLGMVIDIKTRKPVLGNVTGGLSGPAIKPVALRCVYQVAQAVTVPLMGIGGISSWEDVVEFLLAGATTVAVGASLLVDPHLPRELTQGLDAYCRREGIRDLKELVGAAWR